MDIKLNNMFVQPLFVINGFTTDVGIWPGTNEKDESILLAKAISCYRFNEKNKTLVSEISHIHKSEPIPNKSLIKSFMDIFKKLNYHEI